MLVLGDVSGIQDFLFAVPEEEGGQARMLRARSFFIQALTEVVAFRVQRALGLDHRSLLFCAAGRFALDAAAAAGDVKDGLLKTREDLEQWLLQATAGALRVAVVATSETNPGADHIADRYERATAELLAEKQRPWASYAARGHSWAPERLVLSALRPSSDADQFREIGKALPRARWLVVEAAEIGPDDSAPSAVSFDLAGWRASLLEHASAERLRRAALVADLSGQPEAVGTLPANQIRRPLARYVPTRQDGTLVWFEELAQRARGVPFLGVLKMDADSLGLAFSERLHAARDLRALADFSVALDRFFAVELDGVLRTPAWQPIYTVFSGGDDLLLVGPWDLMLDFAGYAQALFAGSFGDQGLTISGALAIVKYRYPIRHAARQADHLLERAKSVPTSGETTPKDQMAALGQVWKWRDHAAILASAKRVTGWVEDGKAPRGWLHSLLQLALARRGEGGETQVEGDRGLATARLAYHVARNYPRRNGRDPARRAVREWADRLVLDFDAHEGPAPVDVRYLPSILRYALLATRTAIREELP